MTVVHGTLTTSMENAERTARHVAAQQGMAFYAPASRPGMLVFRTGVLGSGPRLTISLVERAPSTIEATITTGGGFALTGWGRGQTTANRLLRALIAQTGSEGARPRPS
jgi:hypothetical protein